MVRAGGIFDDGVFWMTHVSYPADGIESARPAISTGPSRRKSIFAFMLDALHHSRRIQSRRMLRQYRHLIFHGDQRIASSQPNPEGRGHVDQ
jgi:hypothetical protein